MYFVHEVDLSILLSELVFCVHEDEAHLCGNFGSTLEDSLCICLELFVVFAAYYALSYDLFFGNIFVMSFGCLCCRGDYRLREFLILYHSFRHLYSADGAFPCLILSPCMA